VFSRGQSDTVAEIADLPRLDVPGFFAETHITEGMGVLLRQVFDRLMCRSDQGVFRLKQAMGGGKTHTLEELVPYEFTDVETLLSDFFEAIERYLPSE
jgi:predicted AAA+ superfamily ATPase